MRSITRKIFSAEFKLEAAQLVLDKNHSIIEAAKAMNVHWLEKVGQIPIRKV
ncbi:hypothetical protein [Shewanella sp.]|uniref:hypothetical protein n=1 Tax=Shewanella sp. TaxID=50422 RepID=UPI003FA7D5EA